MNAAGQALFEFLLITAVFVVLFVGIAKKLPVTFSESSPFLGGKIEYRLQTGRGFTANWGDPTKPKGGAKD